jgi:hypothetical protein
MNDQAVEQEIQAKGLTAPRVTPQMIQDSIASEHFFTAAEGCLGHSVALSTELEADPGNLFFLTFCVLQLKNGFIVTGESACASPQNFDRELGESIARQNAMQKIWQLEGYLLRQRLHEQGI